MDNQARIPAPNYTQIPNAIFDLMADKDAGLTEKELKVLLAIARKTFGWHKKRDKISLSQLQQMTSMSRSTVVLGVKAAIERGIVRQTEDPNDKRGGVYYELVVDELNQSSDLTSTKSELVRNSDQSEIYTKTSTKFGPELVRNSDSQKKDKEKKESGGETQAYAPAVQAYFDIYPNERLNADQVALISATVSLLPRWKEVLTYWKASGYRAQSIPKMLDRYSSGATIAGDRPGGDRQTSITRPPADLPTITAASDGKRVASPEDRRRIIEETEARLRAGK